MSTQHSPEARDARPAADAPRDVAAAPTLELQIETAHLLDYVKVLYKRRWTALTAFLIVVLGAALYSFTATPMYEARAKLLIEVENPNVVSFQEVIEEGQSRSDYYQTQYNILQSRSLARKTLETLGLWSHPAFAGDASGSSFGVRAAVAAIVDAAARAIGAAEVPEPRRADESAAESRAIDRLLAGLAVAPVRNSRIVDLKYQSPDPGLAARIVNAHSRNYIEQNLEFKFLSSKEASDWLGARLTEQRSQVEVAEAALQQYRESNQSISLDDRQNIVVQKLADLNAAVTKAKTDRIEKEALYNQLQGLQNDRAALDTFPAIQTNAFVQQLKVELADLQREHADLAQKLGDRHPDLIKAQASIDVAARRLEGEIEKVVQAVQNQFLAAQAQERSLTAALEGQKREALAMNRKAIEYGVLSRDVESTRQIYESLLQRAKETGVSTELRASNIRIVDPAEVPGSPFAPRTRRNLALAMFGGLLLAAALGFFFEYLDDRVKTPEEIKSRLGLPFLGLIPQIEPSTLHGNPLINNGVLAEFKEAFQVVQTNVLFSSADPGPRSVLVTSAVPAEGKTVVAANLALGLAQLGARVVLVDADMRRPSLHSVFGQPQEPGLSNVLVGNAPASEAVRNTKVAGLSLLTAGRIPPNPIELVAKQPFRDFLNSLTEQYDWVVVDSPPVMAVADASVLGRSTSGVVFVVGAEMTSRPTVLAAIERLEGARAHFLGAVLNRVDLRRNGYYYSRYYRREYGGYYHSTHAAQHEGHA
jgi:capsular exopolysaccharide synthesis family protein